ncbi:Threonine--tRNA ligase [Mucisphaera calidilacus]|uniref:Threonine--tRNA ligase n=2 Tax=Mucisphaera calidilacus TaxID=2527982 RepID=A0A518C131_9BACT|nr:Threonine--tRNA ligase [Mucisphaera calidilacus]
MIITLPDGSTQTFEAPASPRQVAQRIGPKLAQAALGARFTPEGSTEALLVDADRPLPGDGILAIVTAPQTNKKGLSKWRSEEHERDALYLLRHSAAHVMAEAIQRLWPETLLAYGPPLDNGFYYDLYLETPISSNDFERIEAEMRKIVDEDRTFRRYEMPLDEGFEKLDAEDNKYKKDNAQRAREKGADTLSWYVTGGVETVEKDGQRYWFLDKHWCVPVSDDQPAVIDYSERLNITDLGIHTNEVSGSNDWEDLCMGPHVDRTGRIGAFKIMSIASSHWHGDVTSDRFQRVYGTAFFTQADLDQHIDKLEQARARDHRVLGRQHGIFEIDEKVGQGLVLWKPKGALLRQELQTFILGHLERQGYSQVFTPHIGKLDLYKTSGHFPYYRESQFPPLVDHDQMKMLSDEGCTCGDLSNRLADGELDGYLLRPMNCPHHIRIYASEKHSYRDLPIRLAEFGTVYRWEQSGELGGMTRVRGFTQDDAHLFVTEEQLPREVAGCLELVKIVFATLGMEDFRVRVGLRDPDSSKYVGEPSQWDRAEAACIDAAQSLGVPFSSEPGEAAFYGPKIDFVVRDVIGREWQLGTVQVDYQLPQRFELEYTGADNQPHVPVMIHRAPFGSMERFVGVLIEHFNAAFPLWLSAEQVRVLPISDKFLDYANKILDTLKAAGLRATMDASNDRLNAKIKVAQEEKIPYMLVAGGRDEEAGTVSVRHRSEGDLGAMPLDEFVKQAVAECDERTIR